MNDFHLFERTIVCNRLTIIIGPPILIPFLSLSLRYNYKRKNEYRSYDDTLWYNYLINGWFLSARFRWIRVYSIRWDRISTYLLTYLKESPTAIPDLHFVPWTIDRHVDEGPLLKILSVVALCVERHESLLEFVRRFRVRRNVHRSLCDGSGWQSNDPCRAKGQKRDEHCHDPPQFHDQREISLHERTSSSNLFRTEERTVTFPIAIETIFRARKQLSETLAKWLIAKYCEESTLGRNGWEFFYNSSPIIHGYSRFQEESWEDLFQLDDGFRLERGKSMMYLISTLSNTQ